MIELLELLKDDPEECVRRPVANSLNDIAKDHPELVVEVSRRWLRGASRERRKVVEHGLCTLVKQATPTPSPCSASGPTPRSASRS